MKPAKGEKKKEKSKKKSKKLRKKFQTSSSSSDSSSSSSSRADEDKKRSSRASKSKAMKKLVVVDDDEDDGHKSNEFVEDVPKTLDNLQPVTYTTKPDKGSFLTRVALKWELRSSFEHVYVVVDYQLKTFKTNLF